MQIFGLPLEYLGTGLFVIAVAHTFAVKVFHNLSMRLPPQSPAAGFFHLMGELEIVFGFWAGVLVLTLAYAHGPNASAEVVAKMSFREPIFVFVIMVMASTRPVLVAAGTVIDKMSSLAPVGRVYFDFALLLTLGPLLGSLITEPAAMTVTALLLRDRYFHARVSEPFKYACLGTLFVNISVGGALTAYAAPPILMVAGPWSWDTAHVFGLFGIKALLTTVVTTAGLMLAFRRDIALASRTTKPEEAPLSVMALNLVFMAALVAVHEHVELFVGIFLFFMGYVAISKQHQGELRLREGLLVGFFLAGLVVLGSFQGWWLENVLAGLGTHTLFGGAAVLTAVIDNAALTYLGTLVPDTTETFRYFLVAGSLCGGGLTVIANAPNPAGFAILRERFNNGSIGPAGLFLGALPATLVALGIFGWL